MKGQPIRFPPSEQAVLACEEIVASWQKEHELNVNLEKETYILASRTRSWLTPRSVVAGVSDVLSPAFRNQELPEGSLLQLGENLAKRLLTEDLLGPVKREPKPAPPAIPF